MTDESTRPQKQKPDVSKLIRIEYYHSAERAPKEQQEQVRKLGFTKVGQILERPNTTEMHHIVTDMVPHLLRIIE